MNPSATSEARQLTDQSIAFYAYCLAISTNEVASGRFVSLN